PPLHSFPTRRSSDLLGPMHRLVLAALLSVAAGCPSRAAGPGPESTLRAYREAVARGRLDQAYALLSSEYKKTHDRAAWERTLGRSEEHTSELQSREN